MRHSVLILKQADEFKELKENKRILKELGGGGRGKKERKKTPPGGRVQTTTKKKIKRQKKSAPSEDQTHDLQIMRLTLY